MHTLSFSILSEGDAAELLKLGLDRNLAVDTAKNPKITAEALGMLAKVRSMTIPLLG